MRLFVEAAGLGIIPVDPAVLRLLGRDHRFALYEEGAGGRQLLMPLKSADLIDRVCTSTLRFAGPFFH